ncbi:MAG: TAXI family TRAP transporter solute-binding subunit [Desulfobacteraceae bacterium]|nr:TAXI family TRAP transporter solute-binding subunit [Desulfobacteraceae bacterium]
MSKKGLRIVLISVTLLVFSLSFQGVILPCRTAQAVEQLSMGTALVGGFFYNVGAPVAQCINKALPEVNVTAEFTEGSVENLRLIQKKKVQLAVISPMIGYFARKGIAMFKKGGAVNMRVVVRLLPNGNIWATLKKNKDIHTIRDIKGKKVGVGTGGIGVMSRMQLAAHGIDYKKDIKPFFLPTGALADILKDGSVDVSFLTEGLAKMVTATHEIRIISWKEEDRKAYIDKNPYFGEYSYPPNHFKGVDYEVLTVDNGIQLICDAGMSDDMVYKLAKAVIENIDCISKIFAPAKALNPKWCASKLGNPFHPGSIKYFKDAGLWK